MKPTFDIARLDFLELWDRPSSLSTHDQSRVLHDCWLPIIGPSAYLMYVELHRALPTADPDGPATPFPEWSSLASCLGIAPKRAIHAVERLVSFDLARTVEQGDRLTFSTAFILQLGRAVLPSERTMARTNPSLRSLALREALS